MDKLIIPEGKKTGCLPRATQYGTCCDKLEDRIEVISRERWQLHIDDGIVLRPHVTDILNQDGVGSCATESTAQSKMIVRSWQNQPYVPLNPWSIYCFTSGGRDGGSNIDTNLIHARDIGVLPVSVWPRSKGWRAKPPQSLLDTEAIKYRIDEFWDIATVDEIGTALLKGMPVVFGWQGHSCVLVDLVDRKRARYANSWDESWGDKGFGIISLNKVNFGYGAFAVRTVVDSGEA